MTESIDHRPGCQLITIEAYGLCTCDFDARMSALTHPEVQGNKDLGEPQTSFAWKEIESAPKDGSDILAFVDGFGMGQMVLCWLDGYWREKANFLGLKKSPTHWAPLPPPPSERSEAAPTSPQPIKGESELESASNGMGLR